MDFLVATVQKSTKKENIVSKEDHSFVIYLIIILHLQNSMP
jgi:hypothetical protein